MVLNNNTLELINTVSDINHEYNIKLLLYLGTLLMAALVLYFSKNIDRDDPIQDLFYYGMQIFGWIVIVFAPLYILILQRSVSLGIVSSIMVGFYSVFLVIAIFLGIFWLGKRFMEKYFNMRFDDNKRENRPDKDYRRYD